jgi:hypothetical protein
MMTKPSEAKTKRPAGKPRKPVLFGDTDPKDAGDPNPQAPWKTKFGGEHWDGTFVSGAEDPFHIDKEILEDYRREGLCFKWMRTSVYGQPDPKNISMHERNGWLPVEPNDFPNITNVAADGMQLVCRSKHIEDKARELQKRQAKEPLETARLKAGEGIIEGVTLDARAARSKNFHRKGPPEPIPVPGDDE